MKLRNYSLTLLCLLGLLASCKKDDDSFSPIVERDREEQQVADADSLVSYLETHYYNFATFETAGNHTLEDLVISELPRDAQGNYLPMPNPTVNKLLIDAVGAAKTTSYQDTDYEYYVLSLNEGGGKNPKFTDQIRVNYAGSLQDGTIFDSTVNPIELDLLNLVQGWRLVFPEFKTAENFVENGDGTVSFNNFGLGVMFLPSGLGYFAAPPLGVPAYANMIFKFELYQSKTSDHDNDGLPSYYEDLNDNGNVFDDDTDGNGVPNALDADDDGDGVLTINELKPTTYLIDTNLGEEEPVLPTGEFVRKRTVVAGIITLKTVKVMDSNDNGIPDHLEKEITINYNE